MGLSKKKVAAAVIILNLLNQKKKKKKRSIWVKDWIARRAEFGAFHQLLSELRVEDPGQFTNFFRMTPSTFEILVNKIAPLIFKKDTKMRPAIPVEERLGITLRFLASGDSYRSLTYLFRISKSTISAIIPEVCKALCVALQDYMLVPSTPEEWKAISDQFHNRWNFPRCLGAIDGKHVVIQAPSHSGSYFYNYKGSHSIVWMAIVDANYRFLVTMVGCNGRMSDGGVFAASGISAFIENQIKTLSRAPLPGRNVNVPYVFVADDAFPLRPHLLKPYAYNSAGPMRIYNYRLSRARRIVENAFGIASSIFRVLRKPIQLLPYNVDSLVLAICHLHNFLISRKSTETVYISENTFDRENIEEGLIENGSWRKEQSPENTLLPVKQQGSNNYSTDAKEVRDEFRDYFLTPQGEVPWQYRFI